MPPNTVITSTTNSGGCLTFHFESDGFNQSAGFKGNFSCVTCPASPEIVVLGETPGTLTTCGAILRDPGGSGNYNNDLQVQQTICAGNTNECLRVSFVEFETERGKDFLKIYDGSSAFHLTGRLFRRWSVIAGVKHQCIGGLLNLCFYKQSNLAGGGLKPMLVVCLVRHLNESMF